MERKFKVLSKGLLWRCYLLIFITLGTQKFPFPRLLNQVEYLLKNNFINDTVICQTGFTKFHSDQMQCFNFIEKDFFQECLKNSDLIISHAGAGTITSALKNNKNLIIVPRMQKYHEHIDDHQLEISHIFYKKNYAFECLEIDKLYQLINDIKNHTFLPYQSNTEKIEEYIIQYILKK